MAIVASIQGERQDATAKRYVADQATVDEYAANCSEDFADCRQGNHMYPTIRRGDRLGYTMRNDGLLERRLVCDVCRCAVRVELHEAYTERVGKENVPRVELITSYTTYQKHPETGESYLLPRGSGTMKKKTFKSSIATQALSEDDEAQVAVAAALKKRKRVTKESAKKNAAGA